MSIQEKNIENLAPIAEDAIIWRGVKFSAKCPCGTQAWLYAKGRQWCGPCFDSGFPQEDLAPYSEGLYF